MISHREVKDMFHIVHKRQIAPDVTAYIGLEKTHIKEFSNFLAMWVFDDTNGHVMTLKMSTFRKLVKFMDDENLRESRRLSTLEKLLTKKVKDEL